MRPNLKVALLAGVCATALLVAQPEQASAQNLIVAPAEEGPYGAVQGQFSIWGSTQEEWTEKGDDGRVDEEPYGATGALKLGVVAPPNHPNLGGWDFAVQFATGLLNADGPANAKTDEPDFAFGDCSSNSTSGGLGDCQMDDEVRWYMGDLEVGLDVGRYMDSSGDTQVRLFGGVRVGYFDFDRGNDFFANGSDSPLNISQETTFIGAGPRVGIAFRTPLGSNRNIQLGGGLAGAVLLGTRDTTVEIVDDFEEARASEDDFEVVWNAEAELAISADLGGGIMIDAGYRGEYWGNVINLPDPDVSRNPVNSAFFLDDMTEGDIFDYGPFLRLTYAFSAPPSSPAAARSLPSRSRVATAYPTAAPPRGSGAVLPATAQTGLRPGDLEAFIRQLDRQRKLLDAQQEQLNAQRDQLEAQRNLLDAQQERLDVLARPQKASLR